MPEFNYDRAAMVLAEALIFGDVKAGHRNSLSTRTIRKYRHKMKDDMKLFRLFIIKKEQLENDWAACLPKALRAGIDFLTKAALELDTTKAENINAITESLKIF